MMGYTVMNDVSVQIIGPFFEWFQGKNWDAMTPRFGPVIVSPDEVDPVAGPSL